MKNYNSKLKISENISLRDFTTFNIGGAAKYLCEIETKEKLKQAVKWARDRGAPFFVLGGGSNLLISDAGFNGLVIKIKNEKLKIKNGNLKCKIIECGAGLPLKELVDFCLQNGLSGLEWAAGIPKATVGGAVCMNAGAFGANMADIVEEVEALNSQSLKIEKFRFTNCRFDYKSSIFKQDKNLIITEAVLRLEKKDKAEIKKEISRVLEYRNSHHPMGMFSAGSIFKNPTRVPAGELIEKCGLPGEQIGEAQISKKHANFIVNLGKAKAKDVKSLIALAKEKVKAKFNIELEEEVQYLGF